MEGSRITTYIHAECSKRAKTPLPMIVDFESKVSCICRLCSYVASWDATPTSLLLLLAVASNPCNPLVPPPTVTIPVTTLSDMVLVMGQQGKQETRFG